MHPLTFDPCCRCHDARPQTTKISGLSPISFIEGGGIWGGGGGRQKKIINNIKRELKDMHPLYRV